MTDVGLQADVEGVRPRPDELVTLEQERKCFEERLAKKEAELNEKDIEISKYVHVCMCMFMCVCVCVCLLYPLNIHILF